MAKVDSDRVFGVAVALLGLGVFLVGKQLPNLSLPNDPGPGLFPCLAGLGLLGSGVGIALQGSFSTKPFLSPQGWRRLGLMALVIVIYAVVLNLLGFRLATPLALYTIMRLMGQPKEMYVKRIVLAVGVTAVLYYVFQAFFRVMLPAGILSVI